MKRTIRKLAFLFPISILLLISASCIFSPKEGESVEDDTVGKWQEPVTPGIVIENLKVAFQDRDIDFYERCLHENYFYESPSTTDSLNAESWSRSTDVLVMENLFADCTSFVFTQSSSTLIKEYGSNVVPDPLPQGAQISSEHPDDIWYVYSYYITMDMYFNTYGDFKVEQYMKFVMVEDQKNQWSIIRWIDETGLSQ